MKGAFAFKFTATFSFFTDFFHLTSLLITTLRQGTHRFLHTNWVGGNQIF